MDELAKVEREFAKVERGPAEGRIEVSKTKGVWVSRIITKNFCTVVVCYNL